MGEYLSKKLAAAEALLLGIPPTEWPIAAIVSVTIWAGLWILRDLIGARHQRHSTSRNATMIRLIAYPAQVVILDRQRIALE